MVWSKSNRSPRWPWNAPTSRSSWRLLAEASREW